MSQKHEYDGIEERDNDMPSWWVWSFFLCIIFSAVYFIHYFSGSGPTLKMEFDQAWGHHMTRFARARTPELSDAELLERFGQADVLSLGREVFQRTCQVCHGDKLQGSVGPNLVDEYWLHGKGEPSEIVKIVREGVLDKGMPAWGEMLKPDEVVAVAAYVRKQRGTKPAGAKAPQGQPYPEYVTE